ncbi:MAG: hypothetical protein AAGF11_00375 [Myxococcota bacterium]
MNITTDYAALRREGIAALERLASRTWTDFNAHDPGITILEQLCYAITDLGYRIAHDIPDLLAGDADPYGSLYSPATVLTTEPVTALDLRKLVLDVEGVRNAWIEPVDDAEPAFYHHAGLDQLHLEAGGPSTVAERDKTAIAIRGLYRVLVETSDLLDLDGAAVRQAVEQRLSAHRPLGEDFYELRLLEPQDIAVKARIEVAPGQDAEAVLVAIYEAITAYMAPTVRFSTLGELLAKGTPVDRIFEGPRLDHGFLDDDALAAMERRTAVRTSDLIHAIMDVPGVRAVRDITVSNGIKDEPWSLTLDPARSPRLDLNLSSITLMREGLAASVDPARVVAAYTARAQKAAVARPLAVHERDLVPPVGRDRHLAEYTSIQHDLPGCYGIGPAGLPGSASTLRRAQARQLKAYLLVFDQLLANAFAQLGHARCLLSFTGSAGPTYAARMIDDPELGLQQVRLGDASAHQAVLDSITQTTPDPGDRGDRDNRFLDHLLARYGESFGEYALVLAGALPPGETSATAKLARDKRAFLQQLPRVSGGRSTGVDVIGAECEDDVSGLQRRLALALGLEASLGERLVVVEHVLLRPVPQDVGAPSASSTAAAPLLTAPAQPDPYSLQLSVALPADPVRFGQVDFRKFVEHTIRAQTPAHLTVYVHWLANDEFNNVEGAQQALHQALRAHRADSAQHQGLRAARDRMIELLKVGQASPLRDLPVPERLMVVEGQTAKIWVQHSQRSRTYALWHATDDVAIEAPAMAGTGGTIVVESPVITQAQSYRLRVSTSGDGPWVYLGQVVEVAVGLDASPSARILSGTWADPTSESPSPTDPRVVESGAEVQVELVGSQQGVSYTLVRLDGQTVAQTLSPQAVEGTGGTVMLQTEPITAGVDLRILGTQTPEPAGGPQTVVLDVVLPLQVEAG